MVIRESFRDDELRSLFLWFRPRFPRLIQNALVLFSAFVLGAAVMRNYYVFFVLP